MSKERDLLLVALDFLDPRRWSDPSDQHALNVITRDIELLLAQPEQTEQEPVAWMQDSIELYVLEEKSAIRGYVIPLYTAPPKREPLSEDKLDVLAEANITDEGIAGYYLGFRDAEKIHGIGEDDEN